jgi:hypothetical protein
MTDVAVRQSHDSRYVCGCCGRTAWALVFKGGKLVAPACVTHLADVKMGAVDR